MSQNRNTIDRFKETLPASSLAIIAIVEGILLNVGDFTTENIQVIIIFASIIIFSITFFEKVGIQSEVKKPLFAILSSILVLFYIIGIWGDWIWISQSDRVIPILSSILALAINGLLAKFKDFINF